MSELPSVSGAVKNPNAEKEAVASLPDIPVNISTTVASPEVSMVTVEVLNPYNLNLSPKERAKRKSPKKPIVLPQTNAVYLNPPSAAGLPILELLRKLEDERVLSRPDRILVNDSLNNPVKKDKIIKCLRDIELGANPHFHMKKLKVVLLSNIGGDNNNKCPSKPNLGPPSSSAPSPGGRSISKSTASPSKGDGYSVGATTAVTDVLRQTKEAVEAVVGQNPKYAASATSPNVCIKIARRLRDFLVKYNPNTMGVRKFAVIIGSGSYNPMTRMHLRSFFLAKQHLESRSDYVVLGSLLSPSHPSTVRQRYRACPLENIPPLHRLALAQMCVQSSKWMSVDPWEITRRRAMDYSSLLDHTSRMLQHNFPSIDIRVFYLCKSNAIPLLSPPVMREGNYGLICVARPQESEQLRNALGARWNGLVQIADDTAILDASMDVVSAKKVRDRLKAGQSIKPLVGAQMAEYFDIHRIREKMMGREEWEPEEKQMPQISSRNLPPALSPPKEGRENDEGGSLGSYSYSQTSPTKTSSFPIVAPSVAIDANHDPEERTPRGGTKGLGGGIPLNVRF